GRGGAVGGPGPARAGGVRPLSAGGAPLPGGHGAGLPRVRPGAVTALPTRAGRRVGRPPAAVVATLLTAAGLAGLWLAAPSMGTDLSAQMARADFFAAHGWTPLALRWYGGVGPHGHTPPTPPPVAGL